MNQLEQMNEKLFEAQLLERELMRDLTDQELMIVFEHGKDYFIYEYLGMSENEYKGLKKITELISTYCTKTYDDYDRVLNSEGLEIPFAALETIVNDLKERIKPQKPAKVVHAQNRGEVTCSVSKMPEGDRVQAFDLDRQLIPVDPIAELHNQIEAIFNKDNRFWFDRYINIMGSVEPLAKNILKLKHDFEKIIADPDSLFAAVIDDIKDEVVAQYCRILLEDRGAEYLLEKELVDEIVDALWKASDNIRISTKTSFEPGMCVIVVK